MTTAIERGRVVSYDECWEKDANTEPVVVIVLTTDNGEQHRFTVDIQTAQCLGQGVSLIAEEAHHAWQAVNAFRVKKGVD